MVRKQKVGQVLIRYRFVWMEEGSDSPRSHWTHPVFSISLRVSTSTLLLGLALHEISVDLASHATARCELFVLEDMLLIPQLSVDPPLPTTTRLRN